MTQQSLSVLCLATSSALTDMLGQLAEEGWLLIAIVKSSEPKMFAKKHAKPVVPWFLADISAKYQQQRKETAWNQPEVGKNVIS